MLPVKRFSKGQIPLRYPGRRRPVGARIWPITHYLARYHELAGMRPTGELVAELLARANSLLASYVMRDRPNFSSLQVCDLDSVMEFRFYRAMHVMVKVILRKTALPPHMNGSVVFARWCNVQLPV